MPQSTARTRGPFATLLAVVVAVAAPAPGAAAARTGEVRATADGRPIPLTEISSLYCHDLDYPLIRCFRDEVALRANGQRAGGTALVRPPKLRGGGVGLLGRERPGRLRRGHLQRPVRKRERAVRSEEPRAGR